jgi:nucleoside-triphosphatase
MNILVTGKPGVGKTTLIAKVIEGQTVSGFFTKEIRKNKNRVGFSIETVDGKKGVLAHVNIESPFRVSKYRVNLKDIDEICVPSLNTKGIIVIDEIGKMELFSRKFREKVVEILDTRRVIATIMEQPHPFTDRIKQRNDVRLFTVTQENRNHLVNILTTELKKMIPYCTSGECGEGL